MGIGIGGEAIGGSTQGSVAESLTPRDLPARTSRAKNSAQKGRADEAWGRMGLRRLKKTAVQYGACMALSTGRVRQYLMRTPCRSVHRMLLVVGSGHASALVSVVWISFRTRGRAADFKDVEDVPGSGDIQPLAATILGARDIAFTAQHYHARQRGNTVTVAETEALTGHPTSQALDAIAYVAAHLPRPR